MGEKERLGLGNILSVIRSTNPKKECHNTNPAIVWNKAKMHEKCQLAILIKYKCES